MVLKYMGEEVALSLFSSLVANAWVQSSDFLTVILFLLAFQLSSAAAMILMQLSSVVSAHRRHQCSVSITEFSFIQVLMNVLKEYILVVITRSV